MRPHAGTDSVTDRGMPTPRILFPLAFLVWTACGGGDSTRVAVAPPPPPAPATASAAPRPPPPPVDIVDERSCRERCNGRWGRHAMTNGPSSCDCATKDGGKPCASPRECSMYCDVGWDKAMDARDVRCDPQAPARCTGGAMPPGRCADHVLRVGCHGWIVEEVDGATGLAALRTKWMCVD